MPSPFRAVTAERSHQIILDGDPDEVFALFGPAREADWAAGWDPEVVWGDADSPEVGCVFRTREPVRGETIWLLSRLDRNRRCIEYVRATPTSDLTLIRITVWPEEPERARAEITYRLTGLSELGNDYVAGFTAGKFREWIEEWEVAINHYLATGTPLPTAL